jgi:pullulanase
VDFMRTKQGVENSYESPDSINQIDWGRKQTYRKVFAYYQDLIELRKAHPAFRMTSTADIQENLEFLDLNIPGVVAFRLNDPAGKEKWRSLVVVYNANRKSHDIELPSGQWTEVFNEDGLNVEGYRTLRNNRVNVPAISAMVLAEVAR